MNRKYKYRYKKVNSEVDFLDYKFEAEQLFNEYGDHNMIFLLKRYVSIFSKDFRTRTLTKLYAPSAYASSADQIGGYNNVWAKRG